MGGSLDRQGPLNEINYEKKLRCGAEVTGGARDRSPENGEINQAEKEHPREARATTHRMQCPRLGQHLC